MIPFLEKVARELKSNRKAELEELVKFYGSKKFFKEKLTEGFINVELGSSPWFNVFLQTQKFAQFIKTARLTPGPVEAARVVAVWIFYHPDGRIYTFENIKVNVQGWHGPGPKITTLFHDRPSLDQFLNDFEIQVLPEKFSISEIVSLA